MTMSETYVKVLAQAAGLEDQSLDGFYDRAEQTRDQIRNVQSRKIDAQVRAEVSKAVQSMIDADKPKVYAVAAKKYDGFADAQTAYDIGAWFLGTLAGSEKHYAHAMDRGLIKAALSTGSNPAGGYLVPDQYLRTVVELRQAYGVAEQAATVVQMSESTLVVPKLSSELTAYYVSELGEITESQPTFQSVQLSAKKLASLSAFSSEIGEDSVADIAELLARSTAQQFAKAMDEAVFTGTGTSTTGGIVGLEGGLLAGSQVTATSRDVFGDLTFADFEACIGRAKMYSNGSQAAWFISRAGWANSMQRLANAAGGVTMTEIADGASQNFFLGYPVYFCEVLERELSGTTGKTACFFGDLRSACILGMRRNLTVAVDSSKYFSSDALAVRSTMRWDAVVHDVGSATESGSMVRLIFG